MHAHRATSFARPNMVSAAQTVRRQMTRSAARMMTRAHVTALKTLTTHTPQIRGVALSPPKFQGWVFESTVKQVFFDNLPPKFRVANFNPQVWGVWVVRESDRSEKPRCPQYSCAQIWVAEPHPAERGNSGHSLGESSPPLSPPPRGSKNTNALHKTFVDISISPNLG